MVVTTRSAAINALKATVAKNADRVALAFGFYVTMMEMTAADTGEAGSDTLRNANSLNRLKRNNVAPYVNGTELYKDYKAVRSMARQAGTVAMPTLILEP